MSKQPWVPLKPRAKCPVCRKDCSVRVNGTVNRHYAHRQAAARCPGSGQRPHQEGAKADAAN